MSQMYCHPQRIILQKPNARGHQMVVRAGSDTPGHGSWHSMGVWYQAGNKYFADLKSPDQEYKLLAVHDLGIKGFGGVSTKAQLREAIHLHLKARQCR